MCGNEYFYDIYYSFVLNKVKYVLYCGFYILIKIFFYWYICFLIKVRDRDKYMVKFNN